MSIDQLERMPELQRTSNTEEPLYGITEDGFRFDQRVRLVQVEFGWLQINASGTEILLNPVQISPEATDNFESCRGYN
jgi:hypothetical protein